MNYLSKLFKRLGRHLRWWGISELGDFLLFVFSPNLNNWRLPAPALQLMPMKTKQGPHKREPKGKTGFDPLLIEKEALYAAHK